MTSLALLFTVWLGWEGKLKIVLGLRTRFVTKHQYVVRRAPVLVAIALIEYGFDAISAVTFIRERR